MASASLPREGGNRASASSRPAEAIRDVLSACLFVLPEHLQSRGSAACLPAAVSHLLISFVSLPLPAFCLVPVCLHLPYEGNLRRLFPPMFSTRVDQEQKQLYKSRNLVRVSAAHLPIDVLMSSSPSSGPASPGQTKIDGPLPSVARPFHHPTCLSPPLPRTTGRPSQAGALDPARLPLLPKGLSPLLPKGPPLQAASPHHPRRPRRRHIASGTLSTPTSFQSSTRFI